MGGGPGRLMLAAMVTVVVVGWGRGMVVMLVVRWRAVVVEGCSWDSGCALVVVVADGGSCVSEGW